MEGEQTVNQRMLPAQLTPQRLGQFMGEAGYCWVLEDFHKINETEKTKIAQLMKVFMDMAVDRPLLPLSDLDDLDVKRSLR